MQVTHKQIWHDSVSFGACVLISIGSELLRCWLVRSLDVWTRNKTYIFCCLNARHLWLWNPKNPPAPRSIATADTTTKRRRKDDNNVTQCMVWCMVLVLYASPCFSTYIYVNHRQFIHICQCISPYFYFDFNTKSLKHCGIFYILLRKIFLVFFYHSLWFIFFSVFHVVFRFLTFFPFSSLHASRKKISFHIFSDQLLLAFLLFLLNFL